MRRSPRPDEGFAMSSPLAMMSAAAVALAGITFLFTDHDDTKVAPETTAALASVPAPVQRKVTVEPVHVKPAVDRGNVYVDVYNNSNVT
ncbi:MAG: hypothetical protein QOK15_589, partial [Nocardioidaceae bacterium]|nr:hypothetical protein [Nocardioidaceae bacterium]